MKKNLLGWLAMATMLVGTGCSSDEVMNDYSPENAIQFGTYLGRDAQGRADIFKNDNLQDVGFGVYAYYTGQETWQEYKNSNPGFTPNFMKNTHVTYSSGSWTYSPLKYWPNNTNDKVSFFAYAPYSKSSSNITAPTNGVIPFTVANTVTDQIDLTATTVPQLNKTKDPDGELDGKVEFSFNHVLSRIEFTLQAAADQVDAGGTINTATTITLTKIVIGEADHTTNTDDYDKFYTNADYSILNNEWSNKSGMQAFTLTTANFINNSNVLTAGDNNQKALIAEDSDDYIMVIPSTIQNLPIYVEYTVETVGTNNENEVDNSTVTNKITTVLDSFTFAQGTAYKFNLVLGMSTVELTATVNDAWNNGGEQGVDLPKNEE